VRNAGFTLLEILTAMFMFVLAVGGLALAMDKIVGANVLMRRDAEVRQRLESLLDEAMVIPLEMMVPLREIDPDAFGTKYSLSAEEAEIRNMDDEVLPGLWWITVRAEWVEGREKQIWEEKFLRYVP
jgi:type II secretory pathway component PulJ